MRLTNKFIPSLTRLSVAPRFSLLTANKTKYSFLNKSFAFQHFNYFSTAVIVTKDALTERLKNKATKKFHLIDVRELEETALGTIEQATVLPLSKLEAALGLSHEEFKKEYGWDKPNKDDDVIFYCRSGVRAGKACDLASVAGFSKLSNYKGSWNEWSGVDKKK